MIRSLYFAKGRRNHGRSRLTGHPGPVWKMQKIHGDVDGYCLASIFGAAVTTEVEKCIGMKPTVGLEIRLDGVLLVPAVLRTFAGGGDEVLPLSAFLLTYKSPNPGGGGPVHFESEDSELSCDSGYSSIEAADSYDYDKTTTESSLEEEEHDADNEELE